MKWYKTLKLKIEKRWSDFLYDRIYPDLPFKIYSNKKGDYDEYGIPVIPEEINRDKIRSKFFCGDRYWVIVKKEDD